MFTPYGERLNSRDPHTKHQADGGKALLASLLKPFMRRTPRYESIRDVLNATASGHLTPAQAQKAIEHIQLRCRTYTLTGSMERLQTGCDKLEMSFARLEDSLTALTHSMEYCCQRLDHCLRERS